MKKRNRVSVFKTILLWMLPLCISFNAAAAVSGTQSDGGEDMDWEDMDWEDMDWEDMDSEPSGDGVAISSEVTLHLVSENERFAFWYDTTGADIYVLDKRSGYMWSNTVSREYYPRTDVSEAIRTVLLQATVADEEGAGTVIQLCDAVGDQGSIRLTPDYTADGLSLGAELVKFSVSFTVRFTLNENGLAASIPAGSIRQGEGNRIVSITLMPFFGGARTDRDGYLLIPDGSGALVRFDNSETKEERVYSYSLYGQSEQDIQALVGRDEQDIKKCMLPVFGIRNDTNGFLAAVTDGAESTYLNVVPYGYQCPKMARCYFTFMYHYTEKLTINSKTIEQIMPQQELSDRAVQYFLLDTDSTYSDMAAVYRAHLEERGILRNRVSVHPGEVSLDVLMGVKKKGMFFETLVNMTDCAGVRNIVSDLRGNGVDSLELSLQGWNDGGITDYPTPQKVAGKLGGKKEWQTLLRELGEQGVCTYGYNDFFTAYPDSKNVNLRKEVIRDYVGNIHMNLAGTTILVNPRAALDRYLTAALKSGLYPTSGLSLARAGQWLWNSFQSGAESTRAQTVAAIEEAFGKVQDAGVPLQLYGGNQYVLPYADSLREIPDTNSGYYYETVSVPFFQLVVNGYYRYTSVAGNMSYDQSYQKLKWIEYGCLPYYIVTEKSSLELIDTEYNRLFSSEYSMWGQTIAAVSREFSDRLGVIDGAIMIRHTILSDTLSRLEYDNGAVICINYADEAVQVDGRQIEPMDYGVWSRTEGGMTK